MEQYINYLNEALPEHGDSVLYKFKRKTLEDMTARAGEIASRGISNRKVIDDLVISEHSDLAAEFKEFSGKELSKYKTRRNIILNLVGSAIYLLLVVVAFLGVSFVTQRWDMTWAIVVDGVLLWVVYLLSLGVNKFASMKKIFHIFARMFLAGGVIVFFVAIFIGVVALTDIPRSWVLIFFGLIAMLVCDGAFAVLAKHKLAIITWLMYLPAISAFLYIIIGALGILKWSEGWIIIPLSLVIDLIIIFISIAKNSKEKMEVADVWSEN